MRSRSWEMLGGHASSPTASLIIPTISSIVWQWGVSFSRTLITSSRADLNPSSAVLLFSCVCTISLSLVKVNLGHHLHPLAERRFVPVGQLLQPLGHHQEC